MVELLVVQALGRRARRAPRDSPRTGSPARPCARRASPPGRSPRARRPRSPRRAGSGRPAHGEQLAPRSSHAAKRRAPRPRPARGPAAVGPGCDRRRPRAPRSRASATSISPIGPAPITTTVRPSSIAARFDAAHDTGERLRQRRVAKRGLRLEPAAGCAPRCEPGSARTRRRRRSRRAGRRRGSRGLPAEAADAAGSGVRRHHAVAHLEWVGPGIATLRPSSSTTPASSWPKSAGGCSMRAW